MGWSFSGLFWGFLAGWVVDGLVDSGLLQGMELSWCVLTWVLKVGC